MGRFAPVEVLDQIGLFVFTQIFHLADKVILAEGLRLSGKIQQYRHRRTRLFAAAQAVEKATRVSHDALTAFAAAHAAEKITRRAQTKRVRFAVAQAAREQKPPQ